MADMDFLAAPAVRRALEARAEQGIYGYTRVPEEYLTAICGWFSWRHGWALERDWIVPAPGVVPHMETWHGESEDTVIFHLPVLGDLEDNYLQFYISPPEFSQQRLATKPPDADAWLLAEQQERLPEPSLGGSLYVFDAGTMHHTHSRPGSGARLSFEVIGVLAGGRGHRFLRRPLDALLPVSSFGQLGSSLFLVPRMPPDGTVQPADLLDYGV